MYIRMYVHTYVHMYVHTYVHMYVHTYLRIYNSENLWQDFLITILIKDKILMLKKEVMHVSTYICLVLGDISIISKYRDINQHDNHIVRKMLLTILSKDR